jgi:hypothetical protein
MYLPASCCGSRRCESPCTQCPSPKASATMRSTQWRQRRPESQCATTAGGERQPTTRPFPPRSQSRRSSGTCSSRRYLLPTYPKTIRIIIITDLHGRTHYKQSFTSHIQLKEHRPSSVTSKPSATKFIRKTPHNCTCNFQGGAYR